MFEEERSLFRASEILPMHGYGNDPYNKQFKVVTFQYTGNRCPFLIGEDCSIHDKRPYSCQSYPISPNPKSVEAIAAPYWFDPQCSWVKKYAPVDGKPYKVLAPAENLASRLILSRMTVLRETCKGMLWLFDSSEKEWILSI